MAQAQGSQGQIVFQQESTFKTDPGSPDVKKLHFISEGLKLSRNLITTPIIRGNRNPAASLRGNIDVAGAIKTHLQAYQFPSFLKAVIGGSRTHVAWVATTAKVINDLVVPTAENGYYYKCTVAGTTSATQPTWPTIIGNTVVDGGVTWRCEGTKAATAYVKELYIASSLPSLLIEKGFIDITQYFKYNGCKINKFSFSATPEGYQEIDFDIIGAKETVGSSPFDATATDGGYKPFDGFSIASILEGGSAIANVTAVDGISFENDVDNSVYVIGGAGERSALPEGVVKVSGTLKAMFENLTLYNKAINNTESALKLVYQLGTGNGSAGNEALEFNIPELKFAPNAPVIGGPKGVFVELPFEAYYDNDAFATAMQVTVKNTETTI